MTLIPMPRSGMEFLYSKKVHSSTIRETPLGWMLWQSGLYYCCSTLTVLTSSLTMMDADFGGLDAIRNGTDFNGEGFTVTVAPAAGDQQSRPANVTVRDAAGKTQSYSGNWICA